MKLTLQQLYDHINRKPGQRYTSAQIARSFKTRVQETTPLLRELRVTGRIRHAIPGKMSYYFTPGPQDIAIAERAHLVPEVKPYKPTGPEWQIVAERIADSRAVKSLIRSAP